jgi:hypothetical protein
MINGLLKQQLMEYVKKNPYTFGQLKRLQDFKDTRGYELGDALRDLVKSGRIRVAQYEDMVYFRKSRGFVDLLYSTIENLQKQISDRTKTERWIEEGKARIENRYPSNYISAFLVKCSLKRSSNWRIKNYEDYRKMVATETVRNGEIELKYEILNTPEHDIVSLEGEFKREKLQPGRIPDGSWERYLGKVLSNISGEVSFRTQLLDSYSRTTEFATKKDEKLIRKILDFIRNYPETRYPYSFKPMLHPWVDEFFANPRTGTTPHALSLKSRGFEKHQQHVDYMDHRIHELIKLEESLL